MSIMGTRVLRTEDPRLLTSGGVYTDDLRLPELTGAAYVTIVRSPGWSRCSPPPTGPPRPRAETPRPSRCWRATGSVTSASRWPWS